MQNAVIEAENKISSTDKFQSLFFSNSLAKNLIDNLFFRRNTYYWAEWNRKCNSISKNRTAQITLTVLCV